LDFDQLHRNPARLGAIAAELIRPTAMDRVLDAVIGLAEFLGANVYALGYLWYLRGDVTGSTELKWQMT
jgi:hypothetical protein